MTQKFYLIKNKFKTSETQIRMHERKRHSADAAKGLPKKALKAGAQRQMKGKTDKLKAIIN